MIYTHRHIEQFVISVKTGIQNLRLKIMDSGFRRNDELKPSVAKKAAETGRGFWKNIAAAPLRAGCMHFHMKPGLHPK